jgi:hypothetical protein
MRQACGRRNMHTSVLVGKSEVKRLLGKSRRRWKSNIKTDLK